MHVFFSGIGGTGIGPLALIAKEAGYEVSGSDMQTSQYIDYLRQHGIHNIHIGQAEDSLGMIHAATPIDWFVYSSALPKENPDHPEIRFAESNSIKHSKRDEFLNELLSSKGLKMIAIAGTHGKTTTTAMMVWLFKQLELPVSYSVGAKLSFGEMGEFDPKSQYFIYECDEYDRNFLAFKPYMSLITGVAWDHHDVYPSQADYDDAFNVFFSQSEWLVMWLTDVERLNIVASDHRLTLDKNDERLQTIKLTGQVNRQDAWQVANAVHQLTNEPLEKLIVTLEQFPGVSRRFEKLGDNLYSDYAHTAEKIIGALDVARETSPDVVVVYEGLHNRRQHFMVEHDQFKNLFSGVKKLYWVPSYLAREDPDQKVLTPHELIELAGCQNLAEAAELNNNLKDAINHHRQAGDLVLCITAGGGGSLDEWLRQEFNHG